MLQTTIHEVVSIRMISCILWSQWGNQITLTIIIFLIGLFGIIYSYKNFLITMFSIELMYLGITLSFLLIGFQFVNVEGQLFSIMYLVIAAAESAVGLGLLIVLYRFGKSINHSDYQTLRG